MSHKNKQFTAGALLVVVIAGAGWFALAKPQPEAHRLDADAIGAAAGSKATTTPDGVVRLAWARSDVKVEVDGMPLKPFAGLGSSATHRLNKAFGSAVV